MNVLLDKIQCYRFLSALYFCLKLFLYHENGIKCSIQKQKALINFKWYEGNNLDSVENNRQATLSRSREV